MNVMMAWQAYPAMATRGSEADTMAANELATHAALQVRLPSNRPTFAWMIFKRALRNLDLFWVTSLRCVISLSKDFFVSQQ